ncbi:MAG: TetR/AcrR family transcriptional regulator [Chloroflexi bacterium]|nr:TetR/AcrR family transcriptional regulator [Chloroflexota bacterium]
MSTQQRAVVTRDQLLTAAEDCFARSGYDAAGVAEICAAAGVSKGAFYHHFPTKQALFIALLNRWLAVLDESLQQIRAGATGAVDAIERMTEALRPLFKEGRAQMVIVFEFWSQARREPAVWQATIDPYRRYQAYVADIICDGIAQGAFRAVEPNLVAQMLMSLVVGLLLQGMMDPDGAEWGKVLRDSMRLFLANLAADSEAVLPISSESPGVAPLPDIPAKKKKKKKSHRKHGNKDK